MDIRKIITGLTLSLLLGNGVAVAADFDKGINAYDSGDYKTALAEWTPLAEQGHAVAQYNLGIMHDNGKGVPENDKIAVKWYTLAAEQGHAVAQYGLASMYANGAGVPLNQKTALKWHIKAAKQGNAKAQFSLAIYYYIGGPVPVSYLRSYMWTNLSEYNGNELSFWKERITKELTSTQIVNAQEMSIRCLESNYTDC